MEMNVNTYRGYQEKILSALAKKHIPRDNFGIIGIIGGPHHFLFIDSFFRQENAIAYAQKLGKKGFETKNGKLIEFQKYIVYNSEGKDVYVEDSRKLKKYSD